jgi:hypothetical protein
MVHKFDNLHGNPVIAIKGAKIVAFNGISLNTSSDAFVVLEPPDLEQTRELRVWFETLDKQNKFIPIS